MFQFYLPSLCFLTLLLSEPSSLRWFIVPESVKGVLYACGTNWDNALELPQPLWQGDFGSEPLGHQDGDNTHYYIPNLNEASHWYRDNRWIRNGSFHYAFYPRNIDISRDCVLGCLSQGFDLSRNGRYYPRIISRGGDYPFALPGHILMQWWALESNLRATARLLGPIEYEDHHLAEFKQPLFLNVIDRPDYTWGAETRGAAAARIWLGRRHILALACWVTAQIAFNSRLEHNSALARWETKLNTMAAYWRDQLRTSAFFSDFSGQTRRIGGHINMTANWDFMLGPSVLRTLFNGRVPFSLFVPHRDIRRIKQYREERKYIPSDELVPSFPQCTNLIHPASTSDFLYIEASGQTYGQTVWQFMAERERVDVNYRLPEEKEEIREHRLQVEQSKKDTNGNWVYTQDSRIWYWQKVPYPPYHFRQPVNPILAPHIFQLYTTQQIRYHFWSDSFDLCHDFAPNDNPPIHTIPAAITATLGGDPLLQNFDTTPEFNPDNHIDEITAETLNQPITNATVSALTTTFNDGPPPTQEMLEIRWNMQFVGSLVHRLSERYGLGRLQSQELMAPVSTKQVQDALSSLAERSQDQDLLLPYMRFCLHQFHDALTRSYQYTPAIHDILPYFITDIARTCVGWYTSPHNIHSLTPSHPFDVLLNIPNFTTSERNRLMSFVVFQDNAQRDNVVMLGLPSVVTCKQILRNGWGPDVDQIGLQLSLRGIPYLVFWSAKERSIPISIINPLTNVMRTPSYRYTAADYASYIHCRTSLFACPSILCSCLRQGGIMWRLAMEYIYNPDSGYRGVMPNCVDNGNGRLLAHSYPFIYNNNKELPGQQRQLNLVTTHLTDREAHVICGAYIDQTGKYFLSLYLNSHY